MEFTCNPCGSGCTQHTASRDPYGILAEFGSGTPASKACCWHPQLQFNYIVQSRETTLATGAWTQEVFEGSGSFGVPFQGSHSVLTSAGENTTTQRTATVGTNFALTYADGLNSSRVGDTTWKISTIEAANPGGTGSGSAESGCAGYVGQYSYETATKRFELRIILLIVDLGGVCCGTNPGGGPGSLTVQWRQRDTGNDFVPL